MVTPDYIWLFQMLNIRYAETIEEKSIDRDYNAHGKPRETHYEVYGGGISYCLRTGHQMEVILIEDDQDGRQ